MSIIILWEGFGLENTEKQYTLQDLVDIIQRLRGDGGCPWDRVQTHETLREAMLEEAYEAVDAIDNKDIANLKEELGDVLLQVVFHAQIEAENHNFTIDDVVSGVCEKMIYRHPHVFGDAQAKDADDVLVKWEELKKKEKHTRTQTEVMQAIPNALPALLYARKVQKKAADVGFDFENAEQAMAKVVEECRELEEAIMLKNGTEEEEFGDFLFAMVNLSRFFKINPEFALTKASKKFINRFEYVENSANSMGKMLSDMSLEEMNFLWDKAKENLCHEK